MTEKDEIDYWIKLFYSTCHQELDEKGSRYTAWHENESIFREGCLYHIARLNLPNNNVRYTLRGILYQAGEKAPSSLFAR